MAVFAARLTDGILTEKVSVFADDIAEAREEAREVFASEQRRNLNDVEVEAIAEKHCRHCGSTADAERVKTRGSDTIPTYKCPECGEAFCTRCDCLTPDDHTAEEAVA
jgi:predicted RNA-binding Zn-ribbon protein involved in translation (DUF1610 family)